MCHGLGPGVERQCAEFREVAGNVHPPLLAQDGQNAQQTAQGRMVIPILKAAVPPHVPASDDMYRFVKGEGLRTYEPHALDYVNCNQGEGKKQRQTRVECLLASRISWYQAGLYVVLDRGRRIHVLPRRWGKLQITSVGVKLPITERELDVV